MILLSLICIAALCVHWLLPLFSGGHQKFTDIIIEHVSAADLNKSGELQLFWLVLIAGSIVLLLLLSLKKRFMSPSASPDSLHSAIRLSEYRLPLYGGLLVIPFFAYLIVFGQFSFPLFAGLLLFFICHLFFRKHTARILLLFTLTYYSVVALFTLAVRFTDKAAVSSKTLYFLTILIGAALTAITLFFERKNPAAFVGMRIILILQCFLPALLTVWLVDKYLYQGKLIRVPFSLGYTVFFQAFLVIATIVLIRQAVRFWNRKEAYIIGSMTPILIFVYHSFSAAPMYAQPDQHHHGEQMIPWNQIFTFGQTPYQEYTPVSGLFPLVNGAIQHIFLEGSITDYSPSISITMVIFCIITMYLIFRHVGGGYAVAFAVFFTLPSYNRQYMILPVLLFLSLPQLLKRKNLWLQLWLFLCFLSGLYYPLYGAGLLIGTLPLAIRQALTYTKNGSLREDAKKPSFYITWAIFIIPILLCIPLLFNMLNHTLTFSSQTVMADGICLLGQTPPDAFMPYLLSQPALRQACYLSIRFLLPAFGIWLLVYCIFHCMQNSRTKKLSLFLTAGVAVLMISYTYTLVRADTGKILSRTAYILIAVIGIFLPVILIHYGKSLFKRSFLSVLTGFCFALPMMLFFNISWTKNPDMWIYPDGNSQLVMDDADRLYSYYEVPDTFLKSEDTGLSAEHQALLGRGFMVADQLHYIRDYASVIDKCKAVCDDVSFMAFDGQGFYDYLGVKCSATGFIPAARSYEAQRRIWDTAKENLPVVFYIQPESNYYIFRFMLDAGYVYCAGDAAFYPPKLYHLIYEASEANTADDTTDDYRDYAAASNFGLSPEAFGSSMASLAPVFKTSLTKTLTAQNLPKSFHGAEYDFLYLELAPEWLQSYDTASLTLNITWSDKDGRTFDGSHTSCTLKDGTLLIPMGMNACWLLSELNDFTLSITDSTDSTVYETTYKRLNAHEEDSALVTELSLMQLKLANR